MSKFIFMLPPFWSFGGQNCEIRILSYSVQETYTFRKVKNQVLLFLLNWEWISQFSWFNKVLGFYFPQCVCFLNRAGQNPNLTTFVSKIQVFCRPEWSKGGTPWKWILTIFKCKNGFPKQLGLEKQKKKMGSFV